MTCVNDRSLLSFALPLTLKFLLVWLGLSLFFTMFLRVVSILPALMKVVPPRDLANSYASIIRHIPNRDSDVGLHKLKCLSEIVNSPLFDKTGMSCYVVFLCI